MIQSKNLPSNFWVEVVSCANYIQNQMPHKAVLHMTLEEASNHVKHDVSTFKVFVSGAWELIPNEKRKAIDKKTQPLIFVGYCEDMKAYRLFDLTTKDVLFVEMFVLMRTLNTHLNPLFPQIAMMVQIMLTVLFLRTKRIMIISLLKMEISLNNTHLLQLTSL